MKWLCILVLLYSCNFLGKIEVEVDGVNPTGVATTPAPPTSTPTPGQINLTLVSSPTGNVNFNQTAAFVIEVTNVNPIAGVAVSNLALGWTVTANTCGNDLPQNGTCSFTVSHTNTGGPGTFSNTIRFGKLSTYEDLLLSYTGNGPDAVNLSLVSSPTANVDFNQTADFVIEVTNVNPIVGVAVSNLALGWTVTANTCGNDLPQNGTCSFTVSHTNTGGPGTFSDTIRFGNLSTYDDLLLSYTGNGPDAVNLSLVSSPTVNVDFNQTADFVIEVTNVNPIAGVAVSSLASGWTVTANTCGNDLPQNGTCSFTVSHTSPGAGSFSDTIRFGNLSTYDDLLLSYTGNGLAGALTVDPLYPVGGAKWNDYVRRSNAVNGGNWYRQNDVACDGTEIGIHSVCIHGGEKRKLTLTGVNSCAGIKASDALGVFNWTCEVIGGVATVVSKGIKENKGLDDLINNTPAWRANSVTVTKTANSDVGTVTTTAPAVWWSNNVVPLVTSLVAPFILPSNVGDIHVLTSSAASRKISINTDKVTILIKSSAVLSYEPSGGEDSLLIFVGVKNTWLEGTFHAQDVPLSDTIIYDHVSTFNKVRKVKIASSQSSGLYIAGSSNYVYDLKVFGNGPFVGDEAVWIDSGDYQIINKLNLNNSGLWSNFLFWNQTSRVSNSTFVNILATGSLQNGIECGQSSNHGIEKVTFHNITAANNTFSGLWFEDALDTTVSNVLAVANGKHGVGVDGSGSNLKLANIAATNNGEMPLFLQSTVNAKLEGNLIVGNNLLPCDADGTNTNPPFDSSCNPINANVFNLASSVATGAASFVGEITSDDLTNSESSRVVLFTTITDFFNFDNFYRAWGKENTFSSSLRGSCQDGQSCEILDYRLASTDLHFLNKLGNGSTANSAFVPGLACPAEVGGNQVLTDGQSSPNTFMKMAVEIMEDSVGDDDGLCESNEACIYSPNFGAYQGEGDYESQGACLFQDGTVSGVVMYAYPTNGG